MEEYCDNERILKVMIDFKTKPVLEGKKVILRPFDIEDWEKMLPILAEPEVNHLTGSVVNDEEAGGAFSIEEMEKIKEWYLSRNHQTDRLDLAIIEKEKEALVGEVVFNEYDEDTCNVNFRILIGEAGRGKGLGTEATEIFLRYGFEVLGLHKVELEAYSFNPRAERVYRKNGFILEGVKREAFRYNNMYIDTHIYGMLKDDYDKVALKK
ncbi:GNAT family N-acetyltransferase [Anaerocolumna aminovalerica]|jgi:RimJ/RimL family protein N-acetyltransferase|uniref:GNAT family N-acetyltransferase n=2 Tax=Anaerocolumna aminovalerica TaxID=1527 RepID=UPI001C0F0F87|nr:GNAT family protein [Anaerocolumna aminovalerica]MBU5334216.1 GNAT family N-acetyltransferase [Anaerocolumna aminovalerica]